MAKVDTFDTYKKEGGYMTPKQVADLLQVTRRTVYAWIKSGKLRAYEVGGTVRIRRGDLDAFIKPLVPVGKKE